MEHQQILDEKKDNKQCLLDNPCTVMVNKET